MMTGLPGDSGGESIASAERIIELKPDAVRIYPAAVLPDTELEEMWRSGEYVPQSVEAAVELCSELLKLFMKAKIPGNKAGAESVQRAGRKRACGSISSRPWGHGYGQTLS